MIGYASLARNNIYVSRDATRVALSGCHPLLPVNLCCAISLDPHLHGNLQTYPYRRRSQMMAAFMSYFGARRDPKQSARDAIVTLRQQLQMIEKKEEYLQKKIDEELKKAKANAVNNKAGEQNDDRVRVLSDNLSRAAFG